jgi:SnoaL-like domain
MPIRKILALAGFLVVLVALAVGFERHGTAAASLTVQDYMDIQQLYSRYYQTIDAGESEAWANTFTADGVFNTNTRGHDALVESNRRGGTNRPLRHWHSNLTITPTAEGADGHTYVMQIDITTKPPSISTYSRYDDKLVKTSQGWRFKVRQRSSDTTIGTTR